MWSRTGALIRFTSLPVGLTIAFATRGSKTVPPLAIAAYADGELQRRDSHRALPDVLVLLVAGLEDVAGLAVRPASSRCR